MCGLTGILSLGNNRNHGGEISGGWARLSKGEFVVKNS